MQPVPRRREVEKIVSALRPAEFKQFLFIYFRFESPGRTMMPGDNTNRYTKPIQFTPQTTSTHLEPTSTTTTVQPPHASTDQNSSRKRKFENDHRRNDHQPIFGGRELRPNKYSNFIIFETSTEGEAATNNALQILQTSAAKQRITINVSYAVVGNNTYVK